MSLVYCLGEEPSPPSPLSHEGRGGVYLGCSVKLGDTPPPASGYPPGREGPAPLLSYLLFSISWGTPPNPRQGGPCTPSESWGGRIELGDTPHPQAGTRPAG